jgi:hypothetical protein
MRPPVCWAPLVFVVAANVSVAAQGPSTSASALSADLPRYYFKTPAEEVTARAELNAAIAEMGRFKGQLNSAPQLLGALRAA